MPACQGYAPTSWPITSTHRRIRSGHAGWRGAGRQLSTEKLSTALDDRSRRRTERLLDDALPAGERVLVGRLELVADAALGHEAVHARQELAAVHDQPLDPVSTDRSRHGV